MRSPRRDPDRYPNRNRYPRRGSDQQEWVQDWGSGVAFLILFFGYLIVAGALYFLRGAYAGSAGASLTMWAVLDAVFGASLVPAFPALMWAFWGAVFGGSLVFWLHAPIYGKRNQRPLILFAPLVAMVLVALISAVVSPNPTPATDDEKSALTTQVDNATAGNSVTNEVSNATTSTDATSANNTTSNPPVTTAPQ